MVYFIYIFDVSIVFNNSMINKCLFSHMHMQVLHLLHVQCMCCTLYSILYTVQYIIYNVHLYIVHCIMYRTVYSIYVHINNCYSYTRLYVRQCTMYIVHCTVYIVQYIVYIVYNVYFTMYIRTLQNEISTVTR